MAGFYLFVSSIDSLDLHPSNTVHDFVVELGRNYELTCSRREKWCMALLEVRLDQGDVTQPILENTVITCDLAQPSYIQGTEQCILRSIDPSEGTQTASLYQPYYIGMKQCSFSRLRIRLLTRDLQTPRWAEQQTESARLTCIIHIQKL